MTNESSRPMTVDFRRQEDLTKVLQAVYGWRNDISSIRQYGGRTISARLRQKCPMEHNTMSINIDQQLMIRDTEATVSLTVFAVKAKNLKRSFPTELPTHHKRRFVQSRENECYHREAPNDGTSHQIPIHQLKRTKW